MAKQKNQRTKARTGANTASPAQARSAHPTKRREAGEPSTRQMYTAPKHPASLHNIQGSSAAAGHSAQRTYVAAGMQSTQVRQQRAERFTPLPNYRADVSYDAFADPLEEPVAAPQYAPVAAPQYAPASAPAPQYAPVAAPALQYAPVAAPQYAPVSEPQYAPASAPAAAPQFTPATASTTAPSSAAPHAYDAAPRRAASEPRGKAKSAAAAGRNAATVAQPADGAQNEQPVPSEQARKKSAAFHTVLILVLSILCTIVSAYLGLSQFSQGETLDLSETASSAQDAEVTPEDTQTYEALAPSSVESPWTQSGWFSTGNDELNNLIKDYCDGKTIEGCTAEENAYQVYLGIAWGSYVERDNNQEIEDKQWTVTYALQFFNEGYSGNCYNFAATLAYVLQYFGYEDAAAIPALVLLESGAWGDHGLVFLTGDDGGEKMCDCARGTEGWMLDADTYTWETDTRWPIW